MKQVLINEKWQTPPANTPVSDWLNEVVAVKYCPETLTITGYTFRWQVITAVRDSPRHKAQRVKVTNT